MSSVFARRRWRLQRVMRDQTGWNAKRHRPVCRYAVTISNGAFISTGFSRWALFAWLYAHSRAKARVGPVTLARPATHPGDTIEAAERR
jgi:hypothetical protein